MQDVAWLSQLVHYPGKLDRRAEARKRIEARMKQSRAELRKVSSAMKAYDELGDQ